MSDMHEMSNNFLMVKIQTFIDEIQTEIEGSKILTVLIKSNTMATLRICCQNYPDLFVLIFAEP